MCGAESAYRSSRQEHLPHGHTLPCVQAVEIDAAGEPACLELDLIVARLSELVNECRYRPAENIVNLKSHKSGAGNGKRNYRRRVKWVRIILTERHGPGE